MKKLPFIAAVCMAIVLLTGSGALEASNWARQAGANSFDYGYGIAALPDGGALVTGTFEGSATFGPGEPNQTRLNGAGGSDVFVARYNPDGSLAWAKRAGGSYSGDEGHGIAALPDGSALVTG